MKINLIIDKQVQNNDSQIDLNIINFLFKKLKEKIDVNIIDNNNYKCEHASINIFLNCVNNLLLEYSKFNILIPNQNYFKKSWCYCLMHFDIIIAKTKYIEKLFSQHVGPSKIKYISWRSTDIGNNYDKDYSQYLLYCYDTTYSDYQKIIDNYDESLPKLNVINGSYFNLKNTKSNIIFHDKLSQVEFENLYNKCGVHLCLEECYNYNHNINQCMLAKNIPLIIDGEIHDNNYEENDLMMFKINGKKQKFKKFLGVKYVCDYDSLTDKLKEISNTHISILENLSNNAKAYALKKHHMCDCLFKDLFSDIIKKVRSLSKNTKTKKELNEDELPNVSIMTLVHNRKNVFKLAIYNYNNIDYPKDKLQWIVYDSSNEDEKVDDLLPDEETRNKLNIKYIYDKNTDFIGTNRNKVLEYCDNDVVCVMDDDDYYRSSNIKYRVNKLINNNLKCVGCTIMGVFDIYKYVSFIDSNFNLTNGGRLSAASLCFRKSIINKNCKFDDSSIHECKSLYNNLPNKDFMEICFENILVALNHKRNTGYRNVPNIKPNGNHFKLNEKLIDFIVKINE